ncbi:MAG: hypothetical protein K0R54_5402 [Clostridiaceae bacterium]|jgi:hypothetical protein|nr:hypothetical protein [Clostridiaceae bacterium]
MTHRSISKKSLSEIIYIIGFSIYIISDVLKTTMFTTHIPNSIYTLLHIFAVSIVFVKIIAFNTYTFKRIIIYMVLGFCALLIYFYSKYFDVIALTVILIGAQNISLKKIVKSYFSITTFIVILAIISSKLGIIENLQYLRLDGTVRESFGIVYTTDFSAHIFYLILSYCYIKKKKVSYFDILTFIFLGIFVFKYCDARLDTISIILTSLVFLWIRIKSKFKFGKISKALLVYSLPICIVISIGATLAYNHNQYNDKLIFLNEILSGRLSLGSYGINTYGFSLFGQPITMFGNGGAVEQISNYFYIDCSYLLIALRNGTVFLLTICTLLVLGCKGHIKNGNIKLPLIIGLIAINSMVAHHFLDLAYNPFILMIATPVEAEIYEVFTKYKFRTKSINKTSIPKENLA